MAKSEIPRYYPRLICKVILLCTFLFLLSFLSGEPVYAAQTLTPDDIIKLKEAGVSDEVILEMIKRGKGAEKSGEEESVRRLLAPIPIDIKGKRDCSYSGEFCNYDLFGPTLDAVAERFTKLMDAELTTGTALQLALAFNVLENKKTGARHFRMSKMTRDQHRISASGGPSDEMIWENKVNGTTYRIRLEKDRIFLSEVK